MAKKARSKSYSRTKGHSYECKIAAELRELGFEGVVTSRSESKSMDDNKVDLIDKNGILPCNIQLKCTKATPQYFKIREESTVENKSFVLIWNKQETKLVNICSVGEVVMIDKQFFYELIKQYLKNGKRNKVSSKSK